MKNRNNKNSGKKKVSYLLLIVTGIMVAILSLVISDLIVYYALLEKWF